MTNNQQSEKFNLYLKAREVKTIASALEKIALQPKKDKFKWYRENADFVQDSFDTLIDDSTRLFSEMVLDDEALEISEDIVVSLRNAAYSLESIIDHRDNLEG